MLDDRSRSFFDLVYGTDLVFVPDCWKLCGDAHCCSFSRYRGRFELTTNPGQELPLLPGEWAYLCEKGWNQQFGDHEVRRFTYDLDGYDLDWLMLVSRRPGCACDHATRTFTCRLYPLMPVFDASGHVVGVDDGTMWEELERLEGLPRACQVTAAPFDQMHLFTQMSAAAGADPLYRFYLMAYRIVKRHVFDRLAAQRRDGLDAFRQFEIAWFRKRLFDHDVLRPQLDALLREVSGGDVAGFAQRAAELHAADQRHLPA